MTNKPHYLTGTLKFIEALQNFEDADIPYSNAMGIIKSLNEMADGDDLSKIDLQYTLEFSEALKKAYKLGLENIDVETMFKFINSFDFEDSESLFELEFDHNYAQGKLSLIKETLQNGEVSYWINADETYKKSKEGQSVAVKFTDEQLIELRELLNKLELKESK